MTCGHCWGGGGGGPRLYIWGQGSELPSHYQTSLASTLLTEGDGPTMQIRITKQISVIIKRRLMVVRNQKKMRPVLSEEEMDNLANEALEAVLHCK